MPGCSKCGSDSEPVPAYLITVLIDLVQKHKGGAVQMAQQLYGAAAASWVTAELVDQGGAGVASDSLHPARAEFIELTAEEQHIKFDIIQMVNLYGEMAVQMAMDKYGPGGAKFARIELDQRQARQAYKPVLLPEYGPPEWQYQGADSRPKQIPEDQINFEDMWL